MRLAKDGGWVSMTVSKSLRYVLPSRGELSFIYRKDYYNFGAREMHSLGLAVTLKRRKYPLGALVSCPKAWHECTLADLPKVNWFLIFFGSTNTQSDQSM
jgi:hypothetical protein